MLILTACSSLFLCFFACRCVTGCPVLHKNKTSPLTRVLAVRQPLTMLETVFVERLLLLPLGFALLYVLVAPGTKVEESFNIQATHDVLFHTTDIAEV